MDAFLIFEWVVEGEEERRRFFKSRSSSAWADSKKEIRHSSFESNRSLYLHSKQLPIKYTWSSRLSASQNLSTDRSVELESESSKRRVRGSKLSLLWLDFFSNNFLFQPFFPPCLLKELHQRVVWFRFPFLSFLFFFSPFPSLALLLYTSIEHLPFLWISLSVTVYTGLWRSNVSIESLSFGIVLVTSWSKMRERVSIPKRSVDKSTSESVEFFQRSEGGRSEKSKPHSNWKQKENSKIWGGWWKKRKTRRIRSENEGRRINWRSRSEEKFPTPRTAERNLSFVKFLDQ